MGVWIEIHGTVCDNIPSMVAPFVGVWIEIDQSLLHYMLHTVTPFVGVWIEILHPWITTLR